MPRYDGLSGDVWFYVPDTQADKYVWHACAAGVSYSSRYGTRTSLDVRVYDVRDDKHKHHEACRAFGDFTFTPFCVLERCRNEWTAAKAEEVLVAGRVWAACVAHGI